MEMGRGTVGVGYTASRHVGVAFDGSVSGPFGQMYGRPQLALFLHPNIAVLLGGTVGGVVSTAQSGSTYYAGGDATVRVGGTLSRTRTQLWFGASGGSTVPVINIVRMVSPPPGTPRSTPTEVGWTPSWHAGVEAGVLGPIFSRVDLGFLLYGITGGRTDRPTPNFFDVAGLFAVRIRIDP
jgi:hypothetical protein